METKRERILSVALQLITQHGYRKVTMSDVADAAEISRPTLYAEFANKEAIMSAMTEEHAKAFTVATEGRIAKQTTLKGRLRVVFEIWLVEPSPVSSTTRTGATSSTTSARTSPTPCRHSTTVSRSTSLRYSLPR